MATITVNVSDALDQEFRKTVKHKLGEGKGTLGKAVEEAFKHWIFKKQQQEIAQEMIGLMEKGFSMGKIRIKSRDELYER